MRARGPPAAWRAAGGGQRPGLSAEGGGGREFGASPEDRARICRAPRWMGEVMREGALAVDKRGLTG